MKAFCFSGPHKGWLKTRSPGFTITEMMIVLAVIGIAVAASAPAINSYFTRHSVQYAAEELYGDIQLARMRAARNNQRCRILINVPAANQYTIVDVDNNGAILPGGPFRVVDLAKHRDNITFVLSPRAADPPPYAILEFLAQGVVNPNVTVPAISNSIYLTNQAGDVTYSVLVSLAGGSAVYRYEPNANQWR